MSVPSAKALSRQLDPLTHGARRHLLAQLGRDHAGSAELEVLLTALNGGDLFAQTCGLMIARHAGHAATVEAALRSDLPDLWAPAVAAMQPAGLPAEIVEERCLNGSPRLRRLIIDRVRHDHRTELAERLLPVVRARYGTRAAAPLLAAATEETVAALLSEFDFAVTNWPYLVRWHESVTFAHIAGRISAAPDSTLQWARYDKALRYLTRSRPLEVLALCRETVPADIPGAIRDALGFLVRRHPRETVDLLLCDEYSGSLQSPGIPASLLPALRQMPDAEQERLLARAGDVRGGRGFRGVQLARVLRRVAPSRRAALFAAACAELDTSAVVWSTQLLAVLPHAVRQDEVRRMRMLPQVTQAPQLDATICAYADIDETRAELTQAISVSNAQLRASAYRNLIISTAVNRRGLTETLNSLQRIRNDQDPVRVDALSELSTSLPPLVTPEHVDALDALTQATVEARDVSPSSLHALRQLALRLLAVNPHPAVQDLALTMLARSSQQDGLAWLGGLGRDLPRPTLDRVLGAVLPQLSAEVRRERFSAVLSLARTLQKRGWSSAELYRLVESAIDSRHSGEASQAAELWLADPAHRDERCVALLRRDRSATVLHGVLRHLHLHRQDLLDAALGPKPLRGRFASGKTITIPTFHNGFERWLPRQQAAYAELLRRGITDARQTSQATATYIRRLAPLHWLSSNPIRELAASDDVAISEAALNALSHVSRPATSLGLLAPHLASDRARVAAYSLAPVIETMTPEQCSRELIGLIRMPMRVTARKEVLRLAATARVDGVLAILAAGLDAERPHPDIAVATAHAARRLTDGSEGAWDLLEQIAAHPSADVALSFTTAQPREFDHAGGRRYGRLLLTVTRHPNLAVRQAALMALPRWADGIEDELAARLGELIVDPRAVGEWRTALQALLAMNLRGTVSAQITGAAEALLAAAQTEDVTVAGARDIPMHQRLRVLLGAVRDRRDPRDDSADALRRAAAGQLSRAPDFALERAELLVMAIDWRAPDEARATIHQAAEAAGPSEGAGRWIRVAVKRSLELQQQRWTPAELVPLANELLGDEPPSRRVALTIAAVAGPRAGWPAAWRELLTAARNSCDPDVRATALRIVVSSE